MSTNTGRAPACEIASVVAIKVCGVVATRSPSFTPASHQGKAHGIRTAGQTDAEFAVAELREILFEVFDDLAADELRVMHAVAD